MAAQTITQAITPRFELISPGGGSLVIKYIDSANNICAAVEISTATVLAAFGNALSGAAPALYNGGSGGLVYIPKNVISHPIGDGRASMGGQLPPGTLADVA